jgi:sphingomyelin phosphodiesterase acid-like 3
MFLDAAATQSVGDLLTGNSDVVKLAIFGHTHMDEFKLLQHGSDAVPLKQVPSISPVDGNLPSFTVAQVDPAKATLVDWTVYVASDKKGTSWSREYRYSEAYHQPDFTAASVAKIVAGFRADPEGATPASKAYQDAFDKGLPISPLVIAWPQYGCGIDHYTEAGFKACMCPAK